ncbi:TraG family conjugative transposon ATPase [Sphingobacterium sp. UBA6645]|uniref:TraG family conjugative transposon ATPase n=1 Tax=Sphingobacterium sp. UBA6645 TaxID=1947511 RepID=UPI0025D29DEC|nr:TraG family conjugative transposon ATPase [Sphingobacterium sp. UBA6645]
MGINLEDIFPIMDVEHDCILSKSGDVTIAYEVTLPEIFTLSDLEYESLHQAWIKAIRTLPEGTIFHKQDWFNLAKYTADFHDGSLSHLDRCSEEHFSGRPFLKHRCFMMLTRCSSSRKTVSSLTSSLVSGKFIPTELLEEKWLNDFEGICSQFTRILNDSGLVKTKRLTREELLSDAHKKGFIEAYLTLSLTEKPLQLNDITIGEELKIGDRLCQLYSLSDVSDLPNVCGSRIDYSRYSTERSKLGIGFVSSIGQLLPCDHIYNQYMFIDNRIKTIERFERRRLRLQSLSAYSRENAFARQATDEFLQEAASLKRQPIKAHFNLLVWASDKSQLQQIKDRVSSALSQIDAVTKLETVGAPQIFWAGIPGNAAEFPMNDTFHTFAPQAACLLNLETAARSSNSPVGIRLGDRLTGNPLHVDISDEPITKGFCTNRNKFILGPSGSGKSFFTNHLVRTYLQQSSHIVLVDVGHSYKGLCEMVSGYYFTYSEQQPLEFNPFYLEASDSLDTEKKESIKSLLLALWKKDDETFRRSEYVALSNAITGFYEYLGANTHIFPSFNTFYEYLKEVYHNQLRREHVKQQDFDMDNFLYVLKPYYLGGEFDYLLNARKNLDLIQQPFIVFELDQIKNHPILFPVVTLIIMEVFISKMRKLKGIRKVILIEEAWKALMKEGFAQYIQYLFKTVRKFYGEAIVVTQEVDDIISSPVVKQAIINNSDCKILLDQSKYQNKFDHIQELLGLTEKEKAQVLSLNRSNDPELKYKEVFISLGGVVSRVFRTEVSLEEYLIFSTEQKEKLMLSEYVRLAGGSLHSGVRNLANAIRSGQVKLGD